VNWTTNPDALSEYSIKRIYSTESVITAPTA
jgi:hypothetical protein